MKENLIKIALYTWLLTLSALGISVIANIAGAQVAETIDDKQTSFDSTTADPLYVNVSGDTMSGGLTVANITATTITTPTSTDLVIDPSGSQVVDVQTRLYDSTAFLNLGTAMSSSHSLVSGGVGVGGPFEVDGAGYFDGGLTSLNLGTGQIIANNVFMGAAAYGGLGYGLSDSLKIGPGPSAGQNLVIGHYNWIAYAYAYDHPSATDTTTYFHSSVNPDVDNRAYGYFVASSGGNTIYGVGKGIQIWRVDALKEQTTMTFTGNPTTNNGVVVTVGNIANFTGVTGTPSGAQFQLLGTLALTLADLVAKFNVQAGKNSTAHVTGTTVVFEANATGVLGLQSIHTTDTDNVYSFDNTTFQGGRAAVTGSAGAYTHHYFAGALESGLAIKPGSYTSDPCATLSIGSIWYNSTSNYPCYCGAASVDLKMDGTTACF
jgi:hypothetical protein